MATSYNGWPASTNRSAIGVVPFAVAGVEFPGGVRKGDVATVFGWVALQFHRRVEKLVNPGCWGYSFRQNRNANNLSCHSSGTAIDCNAPKHPNGVPTTRTFTAKQIKEVHQILAEIEELSEVVHWGGDWTGTPDSMHFEIHDNDKAKLARVARRIRALQKEATMNNVEKARLDVDTMLSAGDEALRHFASVPNKRLAVKTFETVLRNVLRLTRRAYRKVPTK